MRPEGKEKQIGSRRDAERRREAERFIAAGGCVWGSINAPAAPRRLCVSALLRAAARTNAAPSRNLPVEKSALSPIFGGVGR